MLKMSSNTSAYTLVSLDSTVEYRICIKEWDFFIKNFYQKINKTLFLKGIKKIVVDSLYSRLW